MKEIKKSLFGRTSSGEDVFRYEMENDSGMKAAVIGWAGAVQSLIVPDRNGDPVDVVLGYDSVSGYENGTVFLGAFVGRYANRIAGASFTLGGETFSLPKNDGNNHLHGCFTRRVFPLSAEDGAVVLRGVSPDGEEGFPGTLSFEVSYRLTEENGLVISYRAVTDRDTVLNLTNHSYFNLNGQDGSTVLDHVLRLNSSFFTEGNAETLPTGRLLPVDGTPMDFRAGKRVGLEINTGYEQTALCHGYDHNFVFDGGGGISLFAELSSEKTGILMRGFTDQPGFQLYTGNFLNNTAGKGGTVYPAYGALCLETQHYPDSPNRPEFPSVLLRPGEEFRSTTEYRFSNL